MKKSDLYWLAGLLEGEGSFMCGPPSENNRPRISISMTDEDVIARAALLLGSRYIVSKDRRNAAWKPCFSVQLRGRHAIQLMKLLRPLMGTRRRAQIDRAVASYISRRPGDNTRKLTLAQARAVKRRVKTECILPLAVEYGVSRKTIRKIRDGVAWKHA